MLLALWVFHFDLPALPGKIRHILENEKERQRDNKSGKEMAINDFPISERYPWISLHSPNSLRLKNGHSQNT